MLARTMLTTLVAMAMTATPAAALTGKFSARGSMAHETSPSFSAATDCVASQSTRPFVIRWSGGTSGFTKTAVTSVSCTDDPSVPTVGLDTQTGHAVGFLFPLGEAATLDWRFVDGGPGSAADIVELHINAIPDPPCCDVLNVGPGPPGPLNGTPGGVWAFGS